MIAPEEAVRLARLRRAKGGETWLPLPDVALYAGVPIGTLYYWVKAKRLRRKGGYVDLGEVLEVRDRSNARVLDAPLTYRALSFFRLAANGWTSVQIAREFHVSRDTVDDAIQAGTHALGARNRTHAVALLVARGLISSPEVEIPSTVIMDKSQVPRST